MSTQWKIVAMVQVPYYNTLNVLRIEFIVWHYVRMQEGHLAYKKFYSSTPQRLFLRSLGDMVCSGMLGKMCQ